MKGFVFELEAVLEHRRRLERERQVAVAGLESRRRALEDRIGALQEEVAQERLEMRRRLREGETRREGGGALVSMRAVGWQAGASFRLLGLIRREVLRLAEARAQLETAQRALLQATTARKAVEALRERRLAEWRRDLARREAQDLDELAVMRAARSEPP